MGRNEKTSGEDVDLSCPKCACPLSVVISTQKLTSKRRVGDERHVDTLIRQLRECDHCKARFYTRSVQAKAKS